MPINYQESQKLNWHKKGGFTKSSFEPCPTQQTGGKFNYSKVGNLSNNVQAKEAFELLQKAGLVHKIYHSSAQGIPLGAGKNYKKFKSILLDSGTFQQNDQIEVLPLYAISNLFQNNNYPL